MNWYFPECHSSLSEVTLIFIHRSRLCVNFPSLIQIYSEWSTNPSAVLTARMIARPVWRENYKSNTPRIFFHSAWCQCTRHLTAYSPKLSIFLGFFVFDAAPIYSGDSCSCTHESLHKQPCSLLLARLHCNPWPCDLNLHPCGYT